MCRRPILRRILSTLHRLKVAMDPDPRFEVKSDRPDYARQLAALLRPLDPGAPKGLVQVAEVDRPRRPYLCQVLYIPAWTFSVAPGGALTWETVVVMAASADGARRVAQAHFACVDVVLPDELEPLAAEVGASKPDAPTERIPPLDDGTTPEPHPAVCSDDRDDGEPMNDADYRALWRSLAVLAFTLAAIAALLVWLASAIPRVVAALH